MSAKDELKQYQFKLEKANEALEEYNLAKIRAEKVTAMMEQSPSRPIGKTSDKVGQNVAKMVDILAEYEKRYMNAEKERLEIYNKINVTPEPYRTILVKRYLHHKPFEVIASDLGYSYRQIIRYHGYALQVYEKKMASNGTKCP